MAAVWGYRKGETADDASVVTWTVDEAARAELVSKTNWRLYPRQMLVARATSELCRYVFADVLGGLCYTPEELGGELAEADR
jgi:hypothetical protein